MKLSGADYELARALAQLPWWFMTRNPDYKAMQLAVRAVAVDGMTKGQLEDVGVFRRKEVADILACADLLHRELFGHPDLSEGIRYYNKIGKRPWHRMAPLYRLTSEDIEN